MKELSEFSDTAPTVAAVKNQGASAARVITAITIGNALEFFDFTIYSFLAVTMGELFFPNSTPYGQLLMSTAAFGVGFVTRPIGGIVLGSYADRAGRKAAMMMTLGLMALGAAMIACAPTYAQIGIAAPVIIVIARLIQGFSAGGEVGATTAMLLEYATPRTRSFYSSWQFSSQGLGVAIGAMLATACSGMLSHSEFMRWGWRIPFAVGILVAPVGLYIRQKLDDTVQPKPAHVKAASPLRVVLRDHWRVIMMGLLLMMGSTASVYLITFYMPTYAIHELGIPMSSALPAGILVGLVLFAGMPLTGMLADRFNRKKISIAARVAIVLAIYPAFIYLTAAPSASRLLLVVGLLSVLHVMSMTSMAIVPALLPKDIRATGVAFIYAIGVVLVGGSSQFITTWLVHVTGSKLSPALYLLACTAITVAALIKIEDRSARPLI
ncbi:MFS transporter [Paraburkholderia agricolaris]|uniref:MFS transporter n=1 Tax=Paraburkholderia agricolaris TaxID=2152888 RepID=UPI0012919624|nr:MFS transporter [Paraburkholderia agricolaris]